MLARFQPGLAQPPLDHVHVLVPQPRHQPAAVGVVHRQSRRPLQLGADLAHAAVLDPDVVSQLMVRAKDPVQSLTPRERQVLELMAQGLSNGSIAGRLFVTGGAVEKHTQRIFAKLGVETRTAAAAMALSSVSVIANAARLRKVKL
mgnify:CR=1 FL=1